MLTKIINAFLIYTLVFSSTFALNINSEIKLEEANSESLKISWDAIDEALCYSVYYDTISPEDRNYSNSEACIETNEYILQNLEPSTTYYITLSVISQDLVEGEKSEEVSFDTLSVGESLSGTTLEEQNESVSLKIESTEILNTKQLKLIFNLPLDKDSIREFKVVNKEDSFVELLVESSEIIGDKQVLITLGDELITNIEYTLTVLSLSGVNGENIELGVDGISNFIVSSDISIINQEITNDTTIESGSDISNDVLVKNIDTTPTENLFNDELNAAGDEPSVAGSNISAEDLNNTTLIATKNAESLPTTGPKNTILILLSLLITIGLLKFRLKKS